MKYASGVVLALSLLGSVTSKPVSKARRQFDGTNVQNQLTDGTPCRDLTVIFARGTFEGGNVGAVVGPPFFQQLAKDLSADRIAVQGVDYAANVTGFLAGGDAEGSARMAQLASDVVDRCPDTSLVLSGYSQGAQLVHNALSVVTDCVAQFVSSVVLFGDPFQDRAVPQVDQSKVLKICHDADTICHSGYTITEAHLNYSGDVAQASQFVRDNAAF